VDAQVAEHQLIKVLQDLISSSLKACQMSLIVTTRTSRPSRNRMEREEAERILADRRQHVLHAIARMNGGRGIPETLAQKRLFFTGLPAMGGENRRSSICSRSTPRSIARGDAMERDPSFTTHAF